MKKILILTFLFSFAITTILHSQVIFKKVEGTKANYSLSIPNDYFKKDAVGANVDLKFANNGGASIITVVYNLPSDVKENDIEQMVIPTDKEFVDGLETTGLQNIVVIKRGLLSINGVRSYFAYYRDNKLYYHTITQFRKGKLINLTYTCENDKRDLYMPYIFRVANSLKS